MNLVQSFGASYFSNRFAGAFFLSEDGTPAIIRQARQSYVDCVQCEGTVEAPKIKDVAIRHSFFSDMKMFDISNMGWRAAGRGRFLAYIERNAAGYRRGTTRDNLEIGVSPITAALEECGTLDVSNYTRETAVARMLLAPTFTPFTQGVQDIAAGRIVGFAVSHNIAIYAQDDDSMAIMLGKRKVGSVDYSGKTTFIFNNVESLIKEHV